MVRFLIPFSIAFAFLFAVPELCTAQETIQDSATGKSFPKKVSFDYQGKNYTLYATGVATRTKLIVKVYSVASYMEPIGRQEGDVFEKILNNKGPKQLSIIWARNVDKGRVLEGYRESFGKAAGKDVMKQQLDQFLSFFGDVRANDEHVLRWLPDGTLEVYINKEKKGSIKDEKFARSIWTIWFGKNSVVKRDSLISLMK